MTNMVNEGWWVPVQLGVKQTCYTLHLLEFVGIFDKVLIQIVSFFLFRHWLNPREKNQYTGKKSPLLFCCKMTWPNQPRLSCVLSWQNPGVSELVVKEGPFVGSV